MQWARSADETTFRSAAFQKQLWEIRGVSNIGAGSGVTVPGAYSDGEIVDALWALREWAVPRDVLLAAAHLDAEFERILALVSPRHNKRRPSARLVRIFTTLRVHEVTCLMDWRRNAQFRKRVGRPSGGFRPIGQNAVARQAVREALGPDTTIEQAVSYNQFAWFVWEHLIDPADPGASSVPVVTTPGPTDAPKLTVLPPGVQRRGMFYVADNLNLLTSMLRMAENGIEKTDLVQHIADSSPMLKQSSQAQVLSQAVTLGLLSVSRGTYQPTDAGRLLLDGLSPADVLTPTFVRTVFGFALILRDLEGLAELKRVRTVHASSRQTYGAPRVHAELRGRGEQHGRKRIARLMRQAGLVGASHRHGGPVTTRRDQETRPAPDLVDRKFTASGPNQFWVADITYVPTASGFLYLAVVLDA